MLTSRKVRVEYEGAIYHATCRGNRRQNIFLDGVEGQAFLKALAEILTKGLVSRATDDLRQRLVGVEAFSRSDEIVLLKE